MARARHIPVTRIGLLARVSALHEHSPARIEQQDVHAAMHQLFDVHRLALFPAYEAICIAHDCDPATHRPAFYIHGFAAMSLRRHDHARSFSEKRSGVVMASLRRGGKTGRATRRATTKATARTP